MSDGTLLLWVDDDTGLLEQGTELLERADDRFEVRTATSVARARRQVAEVECIVSEQDLPDGTGVDFLETVREDHPELPFVLFTDEGSEAVASRAISAGVTGYLRKGTGHEQYRLLAETVRDAVEAARAERSRRHRLAALGAAREGISILDEDGRFTYVNEAYADLYGYEPDALVGEHWELVYPDEQVTFVTDQLLPSVRESGRWYGRTTGLRADGSTFPEDHMVLRTERGDLICVVTEASAGGFRYQAIEELHTTARELMQAETTTAVAETAVDAAKRVIGIPVSGIHLYDEGTDALELAARTDRAEELVGDVTSIPAGEGLAWEAFDIGEPQVYDDLSTVPERLDAGTALRSQIILPLGEYGVFLTGSTVPGAFDPGDVSLAQTLARHVEVALDRIERERDLQETNDRLEEFVGVVSHDLRNPLAAAQAQLAVARAERDGEGDRLEAVGDALDRSQTLIEDLLALARQGEGVDSLESVPLWTTARSCWSTLETADATLAVDTERTVRADPGRLKQLLENLFRNAVDHGGPDVTITVGDLPDGFYVADDGPGIDPEVREAVFEAGHSTSDDGVGFGLNIVERIVSAHGWEIRVADGEHGGARFEITGVRFA
jgi:PAS domain S-box-containing protein